MKLWHPHTEGPDQLCACLVALPGNPADPRNEPPMLAADLYLFDPADRVFRNERTHARIEHAVFWWVSEAELLAELRAMQGEPA